MIPNEGLPADDVLDLLASYTAGDLPIAGGRTYAYVYDSGRPDVEAVAAEAARRFVWHNGLDPTAFPSALRLENEVVDMVRGMLGGGPGTAAPKAVGTVTSGGTESCLLAVKAARDLAAAQGARGGPELVLTATAHPAFHKAGHLLGLRPVVVPVDPQTVRPDPADVAAAITDRTVLVVASAPAYPFGVVDPVREIAGAAAARGVPCHVDACVGGVVLPYFRRLGRDVPDFDLSVPGVTSVSVDLHKYGYAPKGVSVLLFADPALRRHAMWAFADWPGYGVVNPTLQGTRTVAPLAAAWATLRAYGDEGLLDLARRTARATDRIAAGLAGTPGLRVMGSPQSSLLAAAGEGEPPVDVYRLVDAMRHRGWYLQPQPGRHGLPPTVHLSVTAGSEARVDTLLDDLAVAVAEARTPGSSDPGRVAAALRGTDFDALSPAGVRDLLRALGGEAGALPTDMAEINHVLDRLPPPVVERLLVAVLDLLFTP